MTLRIAAVIFGIIFILIGIAGFIPVFTPNNFLLGLFMIDTPHNIIHLVSGVLGLLAAISISCSIWYFRIFGIIYALVAIAGLISEDLIIIHVNQADNILHVIIALVALYLGFFYKKY